MFASLLQFLILTAASILGCLLVLRAWSYACAMTIQDPIVYPIRRLTNWLVDPLGKFVEPKGAWDWPSLLGALLAAFLSVIVRTAFHPAGFAMVSTWIAPFATVLRWGLEMLTWGIFGWVILSWVAARHPFNYSLSILLDRCAVFCRPSAGWTFRRLSCCLRPTHCCSSFCRFRTVGFSSDPDVAHMKKPPQGGFFVWDLRSLLRKALRPNERRRCGEPRPRSYASSVRRAPPP